MAHVDYIFGPGGNRLLGRQEVYTRVNWEDDWELDEDLWCVEATWSKAPAMPVATLTWDYGSIKEPRSVVYASRANKSGIRRLWVKIYFGTEETHAPMETRYEGRTTGQRKWFGFVDLVQDDFLGVRPAAGGGGNITTGMQTLGCYGMERLLATHEVRNSYWDDDGTLRKAEVPFTFNDEVPGIRKGNRTTAKFGGGSYVFEPLSTPALNEFWTSADIVEYLLTHHTPVDNTDAIVVPFTLPAGWDNKVPTWDKPVLEAEGATTYSLLNQLIPLSRLLTWHAAVDEAANDVQIIIDTITAVDVDLTLPGDPNIPANGNTRTLDFDQDQMTVGGIKASDVRVVDQVVAQGALKISVASFNKSFDDTIQAAWTAAEETAYEAAASASAGYGALAVKDKEKRNNAVRGKPELDKVFRQFHVDTDWDFKTGDGLGNLSGYIAAGNNPVFITGDPHAVPPDDAIWPHVCYQQLFLRQDLPLLSNVDYSVDAIKDGIDETDGVETLGPLCWFEDPATFSLFVRAELAGDNADIEDATFDENSWSASVSVPPKSRAVDVRLTGAPQYAIAESDMTRLPVVDGDLGDHDWRDAVFTLAFTDQRRLEGRSPLDAVLPAQDVIRRKYLRSPGSEKFEEIYVVPGTMIGVGDVGDPVWSSGGYIRRPDDAAEQLRAAAHIAAAYYTQEHQIVSLTSFRHPDPSDVEIGNLLTAVGMAGGHYQDEVNSVITEISIRWPQGDGTREGNPDPEFRLITFAGELDAFQFDPVAPITGSAADIPAELPPGFDPARFNLGKR